MSRKWIYIVAPLFVMVVIFIFSSQPYQQQDLRPTLGEYLPIEKLGVYLQNVEFSYKGREVSVATHGVAGLIEFFIRKAAHFLIYFTLMLVTYLSVRRVANWSFPLSWCFSFGLTVVYAAFDEFHQSLTPNRTPYIGDVLLDGVGALSAGALIVLVHLIRRKRYIKDA